MDASKFGELLKKHTLKADSDRVSAEGLQLVRQFVTDKYKVDLPADFSLEWTVGKKAEYAGNFPTRIKLFLKKVHGIKMSGPDISEVGNIGKRNTITADEFTFDFTKEFDWEDGDFGDGGSCYWAGRAGARKMLEDHDSLAIRFYEPETCRCRCHREACRGCEDETSDCGCECHQKTFPEKERKCCGTFHQRIPKLEGMGRAWIIFPETSAFKDENGDRLGDKVDICAVYNSYGPQLTTTAQIVARYLGGLSYKEVKFFNNKDTDGTLYINNSKCILIGKEHDLARIAKVSMQWEEEEYFEYRCERCEVGLNEEDTHSFGDETLCEDCYNEVAVSCTQCGNGVEKDDATTIGDKYYCERCVEKHFTMCSDCDEYAQTTIRV